VVSKAARSHRL